MIRIFLKDNISFKKFYPIKLKKKFIFFAAFISAVFLRKQCELHSKLDFDREHLHLPLRQLR